MDFCQIVPKKLVPFVANRPRHLVLAHLVESDQEYVDAYRKLKEETNCTLILDNSMFEYFKRGEPALDSSKLIELGKKIGADYVVLSDYPKQPWTVTRDKAIEMIPELKRAGFKTFYVPQSELGDIQGWSKSVNWALNNTDIDLIGLSILACPIAMGIDEGQYNGELTGMIRLQRTIARLRCLNYLQQHGIIDVNHIDSKTRARFHVLGMQDAPAEIELLQPYGQMIASWDSSNAAWHAINGICYDKTPTMLKDGKLNSEVDFNWNGELTGQLIGNLMYNIAKIDEMAHRY